MRESRYKLEQQISAFWCKVRRDESGCWLWEGAKFWDGYGNAVFDGVNMGAHRIAWFLSHGCWPSKEIDHLCHTPLCVRFDHLRDVSHKENINSRICSLICRRGHKLEDPNLYYYKRGNKTVRRCIACLQARAEEARAARRARGLKKPGRKAKI